MKEKIKKILKPFLVIIIAGFIVSFLYIIIEKTKLPQTSGQDYDILESRVDELENKIEELEGNLDDVDSRVYDNESSIDDLNALIEDLKSEIEDLESELNY